MSGLGDDLERLRIGNRVFRFHCATGTILAEKTWSETHVTSTGGGGYVGRQGGYVAAPTVRSRVVSRREVWVRLDDGRERAFDLSSSALPLRESHRMVICWSTRDGAEAGPFLLLINQSTGEHDVLHSGCANLIASKANQWMTAGTAVVLVIGILPLAFATERPLWWIAAIVALAFLGWRAKRFKSDLNALHGHLNRILKQVTRVGA